MRVERVDHQLEELLNFRLKVEGFWIFLVVLDLRLFCHGSSASGQPVACPGFLVLLDFHCKGRDGPQTETLSKALRHHAGSACS